MAAPDGLAALEQDLRQRLAASGPIALEWLVERTRPVLDLKAIRKRGGLSAEVLQVKGSWPPELKALDLRLQRAGLRKLAPDGERLLERARLRALELIEEGGAP